MARELDFTGRTPLDIAKCVVGWEDNDWIINMDPADIRAVCQALVNCAVRLARAREPHTSGRAQVDDLIRQVHAGIDGVRAENARLREALEQMVAEKCDYMRINNLGDPEKQHTVRTARAALARALLADNARLQEQLAEAEAEVARLSKARRPFSDALAESVIDGQVKQIDELTKRFKEMRTAETCSTVSYDEHLRPPMPIIGSDGQLYPKPPAAAAMRPEAAVWEEAAKWCEERADSFYGRGPGIPAVKTALRYAAAEFTARAKGQRP